MCILRLRGIRKNIQIKAVSLFPIRASGRKVEGLLIQPAGHAAGYSQTGIFVLKQPPLPVKNRDMTQTGPVIPFLHIIAVKYAEIVVCQVFPAHENTFFIIVKALRFGIQAYNKGILTGKQTAPHTVDGALCPGRFFSCYNFSPHGEDGNPRSRMIGSIVSAPGRVLPCFLGRC